MIETFRDFLYRVLGNYNPITYIDGSGTAIIPSGASGIDWSYIVSSFLLIVCIYSVFKLLGAVICKMF